MEARSEAIISPNDTMKCNYSVVGKSVPRVDSRVKAIGDAIYTADLRLPGMLYGKILRSPYAHARIININTSKAISLPGVKAVITGKDTLGIKYGVWRMRPELMDECALAMDKVRYIGDAVAAVAAVDEDTAQEALGLIDVEYEELPAVFELEEAMKDGAPRINEFFASNTNVRRKIELGDVEKGFKESDYVREDRFTTQSIAHRPMEPHVSLASFSPAGKLTIWTSTQSPYFVHCCLAMTLGMREGDIRVIKPFVGGGFGGKVEMFSNQFCSSLLSQKSGKPVLIEYTMQEEFVSTRRRFPMIVEMKTGVKKDGTIVARECKHIIDGGAFIGISPTTTHISGFMALLPYRIPNYRYSGYRVYTNNPPSGPMRGHGAVQPVFASECQLDLIAGDLGIDPVEIRLKNARRTGENIPGLTTVSSCNLSECISKVADSIGWKEKRGNLPPGRGIGIACYAYVSGALYNWFETPFPYSEVWVKANHDGTVHIFSQAADIGQGSDTVLSQIVAEELGITMDDVSILSGDTKTTPMDMGSWSSRVTMMAGNAAKAAAADVKQQIFRAASVKLGLKVHQELEARDRRVYVKGRLDQGISFSEAVSLAQKAESGMPLLGRGIFSSKGKGEISPAFAFGAQAVELDVDRETGQVKVLKVTTAHDGGTAINPMSVEGQLHGSVHMGLGYALTEELMLKNGKVLNPSFVDYKILRSTDMPELESIDLDTFEPNGPFGAKEAGEGFTIPTAPAVANALNEAIGFMFKEIPMTPDKVFKKLHKGHKVV